MAHLGGELTKFQKFSHEEEILECLSRLSDDYWVIHSYRTQEIKEDKLGENEADFLVFNPKYGLLVIESKYGHVYCDGLKWFFKKKDGTMTRMSHDPFDQAATSLYNIREFMKTNFPSYAGMMDAFKFMHAVWFPLLNKKDLEELNMTKPNFVKELVLTNEDFVGNPKEGIERIMSIEKIHWNDNVTYFEGGNGYTHTLNEKDSMKVFNNCICPAVDIVPSTFGVFDENTEKQNVFVRLLNEQKRILDFLVDQRSAAIAGAAGTGKTMVALQRATITAKPDEKVLFLCYNKELQKQLDEKHKNQFIDYYTIDGYLLKMSQAAEVDYGKAYGNIYKQIEDGTFEYTHIIIDEGQDFGLKEVFETTPSGNIIYDGDGKPKTVLKDVYSDFVDELFYQHLLNTNPRATLFIFYDKRQMIQSNFLSSLIDKIDSKATLYKNCRNTKKIAESSFSFFDEKAVPFELSIDGEMPSIFYYSNPEDLMKKLNNLIKKLANNNAPVYEDLFRRVIITLSTMEKSDISPNLKDGVLPTEQLKTRVFTSATFKGLESNDVILIDIDKNTLLNNYLSFYVATSRARYNLFMFLKMSESDCLEVIEKRFPNLLNKCKKIGARGTLSMALSSELVI